MGAFGPLLWLRLAVVAHDLRGEEGYLDGGLSTFAALVVIFSLVAAVGGLGAFAALVLVFALSLALTGGLGAFAALIVVFALVVVAPIDGLGALTALIAV